MTIKKDSMSSKKISVIIDNYNYGRFISQAIESVLTQTYTNYEIIIVDDGSTDNSREIITKYVRAYPQIKAVFKENGGQTSALNKAFTYCSGHIVAFLDSDDYWYPNKLCKILEKHKSYEAVQHYLSHNGKGIYRRVNARVNWHDILMKYGYLYNHSICSSLSFSYKLLDGIFPLINEKDMVFCTDGIVLMMALSKTPIGIIEETLGYYRVHGENLYIGKNDFGERARDISKKQHMYVNKQLNFRGDREIPFDNHKYFRHLIKQYISCQKLLKDERILIYGTEASGLYMTEVLEGLDFEIFGYCDTNAGKHGCVYKNKIIYAPNELANCKDKFDKIIIASSAGYEISEMLDTLGFIREKEYFELPI